MEFRDRRHAGRLLARGLASYRGRNPLILAIPRGGVPLGRIIADALGGELDVVLVHKLGAPGNPEFAIGSISEDGRVELGRHAREPEVGRADLEAEILAERELLRHRRALYTPVKKPADPARRIVIVVDDGLATGFTMLAALRSLRARKPARLVAAVPVSPPDTLARVQAMADETLCLHTPESFGAVGRYYRDFSTVSDEEVVGLLGENPETPVEIPAGGDALRGDLSLPPQAAGLVIFAHGSGSGRLSPRNRHVAAGLRREGLATLLVDLLGAEEAFDLALSADRLSAATAWAREHPTLRGLPIAYFGASTGAAVALEAASRAGAGIAAVVGRGGRPDLADSVLPLVAAPTLLIVGGLDEAVLRLNRRALGRLGSRDRDLAVVPGASHLFEEEGALDEVARLAAAWFRRHLGRASRRDDGK